MTLQDQLRWLKDRQKSAAKHLADRQRGIIYGDVPDRLAEENYAATTALLETLRQCAVSGQLPLFVHPPPATAE